MELETRKTETRWPAPKTLRRWAEKLLQSWGVSRETLESLCQSATLPRDVAKAVALIAQSYRNGGTLFIAGNGGSAADAQHLAAELVGRFHRDRTALRAIALTVDSSILTAVGNDFGYEAIFSRQLEALASPKDIFLALTTSGNSLNILEALRVCRQKGITSLLLAGHKGGSAASLADHVILAPGTDTNRIQECHLVIYHSLCAQLEEVLAELGLCTFTPQA